MNEFIVFSIMGIAFFIYSLLCSKKRKVIYTINKSNFVILNDKYFDLQLKVSIINSVIIVIGSCLTQVSQLGSIRSIILFITILIFWIMNFRLRKLAIIKKYAEIKQEFLPN
ncbi:hypothetical protein [Clostridium beijerinckii]|uniref:Uncharacterized protein n=1 Tax=Clostridium beijerinckii TaxID=1520 RepID=A0A9Q5CXK5_CLOBE|nr:hypothetical protein [Clostridium beijerinckii]AQS06625.1 hypothetical protein CLBIJ_40720 [Clostridium beijerinckii]MBA2887199.1 hypothetical protein [Clostridium beijerinckii]MBA2902089.1 hypothetical protein [Clostridium beijerinckii]MBA2911912.1 hypothetical protein [Clostridium beijerinckii]MBA9013752.1 hypothetical protein [Clostridium beijerinckii]